MGEILELSDDSSGEYMFITDDSKIRATLDYAVVSNVEKGYISFYYNGDVATTVDADLIDDDDLKKILPERQMKRLHRLD